MASAPPFTSNHQVAPRSVHSTAQLTGEGLVARLTPIPGITPKGALDRAIYLPAMLGTFTLDEEANHTEYDTLSGGTFSMPAMGDQNARKLRTSSIDWLVVDVDAPWLVATGQDPWLVREKITTILRYRKPVLLFVAFNPPRHQPGPEAYMFVTLRSVSREIRNGEPETRYVTMAVSEWRDPQQGRRSSTPTTVSSRKPGVHLPTTHTLRASDTLGSLSHEFYGTYAHWRNIRDANGISRKFGQRTVVVSLRGRWRAGAKIKIPAIPKPKPKAHK